MSADPQQLLLDDEVSPAAKWDRDVARRALDELFTLARQYKTTAAYHELLKFVARFKFYSPFNAMLIHTQMPGARYVAPPHRWMEKYRRTIKPGARPIVILQPMGPVMFVFDVSDTEAEKGAPPLPPDVENPFEVRGGNVGGELAMTIENAKRDGIEVSEQQAGSQSAGEIRQSARKASLTVQTRRRPKAEFAAVSLMYELLLNAKHSAEAKYATLAHELGHLYCGHLGTPNEKWWPNRTGMPHDRREFEAESVCYLVCSRLGIDNPSDEYLAGYMKVNTETPPISLECVMKAAGLVEQMGDSPMPLRKSD